MPKSKLLDGITILDFTQYWASGWSPRLLADMGAEVIKVERAPLGDLFRLGRWIRVGSGEWESNCGFLNANVGKKSICVDLHSPEGTKLIKELVPHVDAVMEGFTQGQMDKYGLGYEAVRQIKPNIVYGSLSAFGQKGPFRDWVAFAPQPEAMSGWQWVTGEPDGPPTFNGVGAGDAIGALNGAFAVLAALYHRKVTGIGQYIDTCMLDSQTFMDGAEIIRTVVSMGEADGMRAGRYGGALTPNGVYDCPGGYVCMTIPGDGEASMWGRFCKAIGRPDMITDPRYDSVPHREQNKEATQAIVQEWLNKQQYGGPLEVARYLQTFRVACTPVLSPRELYLTGQMQERQTYREIYHPVINDTAGVMIVPYQFSETPVELQCGVPLLGQDNELILKQYLSYSDSRIAQLREDGVIQQDGRVAQLRAQGKI